MRQLVIIGVLSACLLGGTPFAAMADEKTEKALEERIKRLEKMVEDLTKHERKEAREEAKEKGKEKPAEAKTGEQPLGFGSTGSGKLIYAKPFVSAPKATVGGYMDFEMNFLTDQQLTRSRATNFDQARFIPFLYGDVTDRIKVAAEIEIEHGGPHNPKAEGEIKIEFATVDYLVTEPFNLRAGLLLMPVGKFNLLHDSPLNDLTDRPLVSRLIIPSTWTETGAGFYGTLYPGRLSKLDYEFYVFNGFALRATDTAAVAVGDGLRNLRGFQKTDNNNNKGAVGRVAFSPFLGVEVAGSAAHSAYSRNADKYATLWAIDWTLQRGPFEVIGEAAWARIDASGAGGLAPTGMQGNYIQGNYHFMPEFLKKWAPRHFSDASTFTAVVRWDSVDTDTDDRTLTAISGNTRELQRLTLGLNYRPLEDFVVKFDYQFNTQLKTNYASTPTGEFGRIDGNGLVISVATYF